MNLLIITQKVDINDDVLGFMHGWIAEFAKHCEKLTVICLQKSEYSLPGNIKILSLGKNNYQLRINNYELFKKIKYLFNFYRYIWRERKNYDAVFVHMNQIYVILGGFLWRLWHKKIALWYAHGQVSFSLKIAKKLTDVIFTSTKSGFRLKSKKIKVIGQGIDVNKLIIKNYELNNNDNFKIIAIGRISPVKNYETLIEAVEILHKERIKLSVDIIGQAGTAEQEKYFAGLKKMVQDKNLGDIINFRGAVPNKNIVECLHSADLFVSTGLTGSLDKAMAEAMSCGLPLLTCNEAMFEVLGEYKEKLMYNKKDFTQLSDKIKMIINLDKNEKQKMAGDLRDIVINNHSLENFVKKIVNDL